MVLPLCLPLVGAAALYRFPSGAWVTAALLLTFAVAGRRLMLAEEARAGFGPDASREA